MKFKYHDCKVERVAFANNFGLDIPDPIEREKIFKYDEPLEKYPDEMPEEEKKKKDEEKVKKAQEEFDESQNVAKRKGVRIFIYG